jgi:hypothetical protein
VAGGDPGRAGPEDQRHILLALEEAAGEDVPLMHLGVAGRHQRVGQRGEHLNVFGLGALDEPDAALDGAEVQGEEALYRDQAGGVAQLL